MKTVPKPLNKVLREIAHISAIIYQKGWAEKNAGNLSIDITDMMSGASPALGRRDHPLGDSFQYLRDRYLLFTKSGSKFRDIADSPREGLIFVKVNNKGDGYYSLRGEERERPTSEIISHLVIQNHLRKIKSTATVVLHTHPTEIITLSHIKEYRSSIKLNRLLSSAHPEILINLPDGIGFVPYIPAGSKQLAYATLSEVRKGKRVIIWERHGALAIESDLTTAFDNLEIVNKAAFILLQMLIIGRTPYPLEQKR